MAGSLISTAFDLLPSFNGFDGLTEAHGGAGSTYNKRKRAKKAAKSGASGGGLTPKTDAKKQELVRKHTRLALHGPAYKHQTSPTSRRIVSNFQLQKQTTQKDYSQAIQSSIRRNTKKNWKNALQMTKKRGQV